MGLNPRPSLPEDAFQQQPLSGGDGRFLLVADVRLDDRAAFANLLGLRESLAIVSDAALLMKGVERWGIDVVDRLYGDFAFALWDDVEQRLTLARDPTGQRPLHYHSNAHCFAFSSMPRPLWAVDGLPRGIDPRRMAEFVADMAPPPDKTYYREIDRLRTGHILNVTRKGLQTRRYWEPLIRPLNLRSQSQYVEAFRERVDEAVRSRLRGAGNLVATHLSAGMDSSTVTATAARLLGPEGGKVLAFTSAPREGFSQEMPRGRIADESPYAAMTAALYPNVEHVVVRSAGESPLFELEQKHAWAQYPSAHASNSVWVAAINAEASRRGATVLLTGQLGNFTLSAAGLGLLADLIRKGRWLRWLQEARSLVRKSPARWRGVLANSFGPWMPRAVWREISAAFLGTSRRANTPYLLSPDWAKLIDNSRNLGRDTFPAKNSYDLRLRLLQRYDIGVFRKAALLRSGIDERDPTSDRRLIEFCLNLPHDQLLKNGVTRPLARLALADRLPPTIIEDAPRGYQMADWYEALHPAAMRQEVELVEKCPLACSIINVGRLREMAENWPQGDWNSNRVVQDYRFSFLMALSAAHFIRHVSAAAER